MERCLSVCVLHIKVDGLNALQELQELQIASFHGEVKQSAFLVGAVAEAKDICTMLLHLAQLLKVAFSCCSFSQVAGALHLLKMVHHLSLGHWRVAVRTLLNVLDAVVIV